jgi:hypothetical protein
VLSIVGDALGIAMTPDRIDLIDVGKLPVPKIFDGDMLTTNQDAGLFMHFPDRGSDQWLIKRIFGTRDGLPETGLVRSFQQ